MAETKTFVLDVEVSVAIIQALDVSGVGAPVLSMVLYVGSRFKRISFQKEDYGKSWFGNFIH